ncbi:MAG TPA: ClbS/DfsB family four-helix bundle protein [Longilinea sp.]|nr:ClbS/DfsB family four-helix bundle protein [Longilinea sp.]
MPKQTSKAQLLKDIYTERRRLEKNLADLGKEEMLRPGVTGAWSVKDILAHLTAWEKLFLGWYSAGLKGSAMETSPVGMCQTAMDSINERIYAQNKDRNLEDVLTEFQASFQEVMDVIEAIPEEDMFGKGRYPWTGKLVLVDYIAGNTCSHYAWAKTQIRKRYR